MDTGYQSKEYSESNRAEGIDRCKSEIPLDILCGGGGEMAVCTS